MLAILERRVREDPSHADSWRLIAKIQHRAGDTDAAITSLNQALQADSESVATHFDLGQILESIGDPIGAAIHYSTVCELAPESGYAQRLRQQGFEPQPSVVPVGYEIKTFDGSEDFLRQLDSLEAAERSPASRWRAFIEAGLLYNSNVSLTPISRQLTNADASSFQGFLNPEFQLALIDREVIRTGPLTRGYFSVNEHSQRNYDLAAFQGGWFAERDYGFLGKDWIGRLDYLYSLDLQGGRRFAERHSLNLSATSISVDGDILYLYGSLSLSDFADDGIDPSYDSLDGPGFYAGFTRYVQLERHLLQRFRFGADLSSANTEGSDYRFFGAGINGGITIAINQRLRFEPEMGLGFRNYDDYTGPVNRDEMVFRLASRLERQFTDRMSLALVVGYNRFASDNRNFDAKRTEGGLVASWLY